MIWNSASVTARNEEEELCAERHWQTVNGTRAIIRLSYNHTNKQMDGQTNAHRMKSHIMWLATKWPKRVSDRSSELERQPKYKQVHIMSEYSRNALELHNLIGKREAKQMANELARPSPYHSHIFVCVRFGHSRYSAMLNLQTVSNFVLFFLLLLDCEM